jgi:hypothetical protein
LVATLGSDENGCLRRDKSTARRGPREAQTATSQPACVEPVNQPTPNLPDRWPTPNLPVSPTYTEPTCWPASIESASQSTSNLPAGQPASDQPANLHQICWKIGRARCQPWQGVIDRVIASEARQGVACEAGRTPGVYRRPFLHRQSLQNKQCFHNLYAYLSVARNKIYLLVSLHRTSQPTYTESIWPACIEPASQPVRSQIEHRKTNHRRACWYSRGRSNRARSCKDGRDSTLGCPKDTATGIEIGGVTGYMS